MEEVLESTTGDWQVKVEIYQTYVRKIPKTEQEIVQHIRKSSWAQNLPDNELKKMAQVSVYKHIHSCQLIQEKNLPPWLFGHPVFLHKGIIQQDRVKMLGEYIMHISSDEFQKIMEEYIKITHLLWKHGLFETSFNLTLNNGLDTKGRLIFVDVGECNDDKSEALRLLQEKQFKRCFSVTKGLNEKQRKIFLDIAKMELTPERLKEIWNEGEG